MKRMLSILGLTSLWVVLWRDISVANVASGLVVSAVVSSGIPRSAEHRVRPLALARFVGYFAVELVRANLVLAREVVTPQNQIETGIIAVPLDGYSDFVATIVANATSLTPGTLTLELVRRPEPVLFVHVLHLHDLADARADVENMARRVEAAFPQTAPVTR